MKKSFPLVAEVQRGDDAVQLSLWAGLLGQCINVAIPVALVTTAQKGHAFRWGWA